MFRIRSTIQHSLLIFVFGVLSLTAAAQDDATPLISWHPDGSMLAVTNLEGVTILDAGTLETLNTIPGTIEGMTPGFLVNAEWSPDGTRIALFNNMTVEIWGSPWLPHAMVLHATVLLSTAPKSIAWSPNGEQIAIAKYDLLLIADTTSGEITDEFNRGWSTIWHVVWTLEDEIALTSTERLTAIVSPTTGEIETSYVSDYTHIVANTAVSFSPNRAKLAIGDSQGTIEIRDVTQASGLNIEFVTGTDQRIYLPTYKYVMGDESVWVSPTTYSLDWSFDGRYLASASSDGTVRIWNPDTGENLTTVTVAPGAWVGSAAWRPNSLELAYGNLDGSVTILVPDNVVPASTPTPTKD